MKKSAGLVIIKNNKLLLCHPSNGTWEGRHSIPKGEIEIEESIIDAAIRETKEEVGLLFDLNRIEKTEYIVEYKKGGKGDVFKIVYYFIVRINDNELPDVLPKEQLQLSEVDWAGFLTYEEAKKCIFWRFNELLELIKYD